MGALFDNCVVRNNPQAIFMDFSDWCHSCLTITGTAFTNNTDNIKLPAGVEPGGGVLTAFRNPGVANPFRCPPPGQEDDFGCRIFGDYTNLSYGITTTPGC